MLDKYNNTAYNEKVVVYGEKENLRTDEELCVLSSKGDLTAAEELVYRYTKLVRACARPFFLIGGDTEDLVQEGMIGLVRAIQDFDPSRETLFYAYAARCVKNRLVSAVRLASRGKHSPLNHYESLETLSLPGTPVNPEDLVLGREAYAELFSALEGILSGMELEILQFYLEGLTYRDIADRLGKEPKAVDNAVQRIRRKLAGHNPWRSQDLPVRK